MAFRMPTIECVDGEQFAYKWTFRRDNIPFDFTGWSGVIFARHRAKAPGDCFISARPVTIPTPTNGEVFYTFTSTDTGIVESSTGQEIDGEYALRFTKGSEIMKSPKGELQIHRDPMQVAT